MPDIADRLRRMEERLGKVERRLGSVEAGMQKVRLVGEKAVHDVQGNVNALHDFVHRVADNHEQRLLELDKSTTEGE